MIMLIGLGILDSSSTIEKAFTAIAFAIVNVCMGFILIKGKICVSYLPSERLVERAHGGVDLGVHLELRDGGARAGAARRADRGRRDLAPDRLQRRWILLETKIFNRYKRYYHQMIQDPSNIKKNRRRSSPMDAWLATLVTSCKCWIHFYPKYRKMLNFV